MGRLVPRFRTQAQLNTVGFAPSSLILERYYISSLKKKKTTLESIIVKMLLSFFRRVVGLKRGESMFQSMMPLS